MSRAATDVDAHALLDAARAGADVDPVDIHLALRRTGDIAPKAGWFKGCSRPRRLSEQRLPRAWCGPNREAA